MGAGGTRVSRRRDETGSGTRRSFEPAGFRCASSTNRSWATLPASAPWLRRLEPDASHSSVLPPETQQSAVLVGSRRLATFPRPCSAESVAILPDLFCRCGTAVEAIEVIVGEPREDVQVVVPDVLVARRLVVLTGGHAVALERALH